jgi:hypothetical protein
MAGALGFCAREREGRLCVWSVHLGPVRLVENGPGVAIGVHDELIPSTNRAELLVLKRISLW